MVKNIEQIAEIEAFAEIGRDHVVEVMRKKLEKIKDYVNQVVNNPQNKERKSELGLLCFNYMGLIQILRDERGIDTSQEYCPSLTRALEPLAGNYEGDNP